MLPGSISRSPAASKVSLIEHSPIKRRTKFKSCLVLTMKSSLCEVCARGIWWTIDSRYKLICSVLDSSSSCKSFNPSSSAVADLSLLSGLAVSSSKGFKPSARRYVVQPSNILGRWRRSDKLNGDSHQNFRRRIRTLCSRVSTSFALFKFDGSLGCLFKCQ